MIKKENLEIKNVKKSSIQNSKFLILVIGGVIATLAFDAAMYIDIEITGVHFDIVETLGYLAVGENEYSETVGHAIHFVHGVGLALLFGYVALPISKRIVRLPICLYATIFSVVELIVGAWFGLLPVLGGGIAGLEMSPLIPVMTLSRHIVYGLVLGAILTQRRNN